MSLRSISKQQTTMPTEMRTALYAGSFNPFTIGHLSILRRGAEIFDRVVVMIGVNCDKEECRESECRAEDLAARLQALEGLENVEVMQWSGLTIDAAKSVGARWLLRGVRSVTDFEYERNLADVNRRLSGIETVILMAEPQLAMISSSMVRELERFGHDVTPYII